MTRRYRLRSSTRASSRLPSELGEDNATLSGQNTQYTSTKNTVSYPSFEDESVGREDHKGSDFVDVVADPVVPFYFALRKASSQPSTASRIVKDLARKLDPNRGLCLITSHNNYDAVLHHCHLLPQSDRNEHTKLTSLEWAWGIQYFSLNVDKPTNMIRLKCDLHALFDRGQFIFLPSTNVIEQLYKHELVRAANPNTQLSPITDKYNGQTIFEYRLVPLGKMGAMCCVLRDPNAPTTVSAADQVLGPEVLHCYPYDTLPVLRSHVLPHFVLYNSGRELVKKGKLEVAD
ncbi:hypothetical protein EW146_g618 [Bondarzewia mesenterica]|uniref:HNH nuclease domain-containing protein n=1 Tax=Bondarzewia mesenterica TaxID=1095465 RepID=A0A4S4M6C4_9AGAM|nr:hypothetical protein EW146_g618 [Bondarzewia mesenterica]